MEDFVKKMLDGNGIDPPQACLEALSVHFENAQHADWFERSTFYEAIFYKDNIEHIAHFEPSGALIEYRQNLPVDMLPEAIKKDLQSRGEIMNAVLRNKGNTLEYEVIVRDCEMHRHLINFDGLGLVKADRLL
jgi:hypothetical protein